MFLPLQIFVRAARAAGARYRSVPASVLYPQLFLALGWLRASVAHIVSANWWSGEELLRFLDAREETRLPIYEPFIDLLIRPMPVLVSAAVLLLQLLTGLALLANIRPVTWILVGIFLNTHFILAGAVNPSVFYVVIGMAVLLWLMWDRMTPARAYRVSIGASVLAALAVLWCGPFITTFDPASVIEDPSLILITLSCLFAMSCWMLYSELIDHRERAVPQPEAPALQEPTDGSADHSDSGIAAQTRSSDGTMGSAGANGPRGRLSGARFSASKRAGADDGDLGSSRRGGGSAGRSLETDLQDLRAASPAEIMEAMDRPIP
ncbi:MAG: hypothetical protein OER95_17430, partial [Acidimicrobiia bacterium]|nr:hypothetical protein [Acidimicrobiia bacterium]